MDWLLWGIEKPGRYIGKEINSYRKEFEEADVRFALAFPDVYEVGLSHLGLRLLYHRLNRMDRVMADRVYAPWHDFEQRLRAEREPLRGIESRRPLYEFDLVGFSLQYELSTTNILTMLDLGGIPMAARDRKPADPWVVGGGPCAFNAEPLADFFDFLVLGEAEEVLHEIIMLFREWARDGKKRSRLEFLQAAKHLSGIYVPSFFQIHYHSTGVIAAIEPKYPEYARVEKRVIADLDEGSPLPEKPLVPLLEIVHDRLGLEIARGCTRGCRFCQAGFIYRPVRERRPGQVLRAAEQALQASGYEEVSFLSLSSGDYCQVQNLLRALMERFTEEKVAVSLPSMRVGTLTPELMELIREVRKTGFTLAPEAGSERLRKVINKDVSDSDLLATAENAFQLGWRLLKLYFMIGLPTEEQQDIDALVRLCMDVWKLGKSTRSSLNVSVSTFVPKPHTPFQWCGQCPRERVERLIKELTKRLKRPGLRFKWHHPGHSFLEAVLARGDRRLAGVIERAWMLGARFDGWTEHFKEDAWRRAFQESGLDPTFYALRERSLEEILPWDHLSSGVEKDFLIREYEKAMAAEFTGDCRWTKCSKCGVCDHRTIKPVLYAEEPTDLRAEGETEPLDAGGEHNFLYRLRYSKTGDFRFFGQLEVARSFTRALRRSGLPVAYSKGFHPHIKLSFGRALALGLESLVEEAHLALTRDLPAEEIMSRINADLPEGLKIEEIVRVNRRRQTPAMLRVTYRVSGLLPLHLHSILQNWPKHLEDFVVKKTKKGEIRAQLSEVLLDVRQVSETALEMDLCEGERMSFRPMTVLELLSGECPESIRFCRICKVDCAPRTDTEEIEDVRRAHH